jgi:hypothetical protein
LNSINLDLTIIEARAGSDRAPGRGEQLLAGIRGTQGGMTVWRTAPELANRQAIGRCWIAVLPAGASRAAPTITID